MWAERSVNAKPGGTNTNHWVYMIIYHRMIEPRILRIFTDIFICSEEPRKNQRNPQIQMVEATIRQIY